MTTQEALAHQERQYELSQPVRTEAPDWEDRACWHDVRDCSCMSCHEWRAHFAYLAPIHAKIDRLTEAAQTEYRRRIAAGWRDPREMWDQPF